MKEEAWREQQRKRKAEQRELVSRRQSLADQREYISLANAAAPDWARGCGSCNFGITGMQCENGPLPLFLLRALLAERHLIDFCDCRAGQMARQHARRVYAAIARRDEIISPFAAEALEAWIEQQSAPPVSGKRVMARRPERGNDARDE